MAKKSVITRRAVLEAIVAGAGALVASSCSTGGRQVAANTCTADSAGGAREFHHLGIPTGRQQKNEKHMADAKLYVTEVADSPNRIEFLRFEAGSPLPELLQRSAHIAYKVKDVKKAMAGKQVLMEPFSPAKGVTVGFVVEEGIPIEFMQVD